LLPLYRCVLLALLCVGLPVFILCHFLSLTGISISLGYKTSSIVPLNIPTE
jgi:hypothetical protein